MTFQTINIPIASNGLNKDIEPTSLSGSSSPISSSYRYSPNMKNIILTRNGARKRGGYSQFGANLPLTGIGMELIEYADARNTVHLLAITSSNVYKYNTSTEAWDNITPGTSIETCESGWSSGDGVDILHSATVFHQGSKSLRANMNPDFVPAGDILAYKDISSLDISDKTHIGFWVRTTSVPSFTDNWEIVISESNHAAGEKTGTYVSVISDTPIVAADTWYYVQVAADLSALNSVISISVWANQDMGFAYVFFIDDIRAIKTFTGDADNHFTSTVTHDATEFANNGGTALIISNGTDDLALFEGHSDDRFIYAADALSGAGFGFPSFGNAKELADLWNHFFILNYNNGNDNVRSLVYAGFADIDDWTSVSSAIHTLTDSRGAIVRARRLGDELVVYSTRSISTGRYLGGPILFAFPTLVYEAGLFAFSGIWSFVNAHYFLSTDQKIYAYQGGSQLIPVGEAIEDSLFANLDISKKNQVTSGVDLREHLLHFFYPRSSDTYAKVSYAMNYKRAGLPWMFFEFNDTVRAMSQFENKANWYCDDSNAWFGSDGLKDLYVDEVDFFCDDSSTQVNFPMPVFISGDGYVFRMDGVTRNDNGNDIECIYETEDITIDKEEHFGRWSWFSFIAKADITSSSVNVYYSIDGGENWVELDDSSVSLTSTWTPYRLPFDVVSRKIRFRLLQNSSGDLQIRDNMHCKVQVEPDRD